MSIEISITIDDALARDLQARLNRLLLGQNRIDDLFERLTAVGEMQTRRRIEEEQTSPDGVQWPEWSKQYAKTRHSGQSLLIGEGNLLQSLEAFVSGDQAGWGSNLVYAAAQQFGREEINLPARPYLGISESNLDEMIQEMNLWLEEVAFR